jgi:two-component sensor histidine kinase
VTLSKIYRAKAVALAKQAKTASAPRFKRRLEKMALAHERLAEKYRIKLWEKKSQSERGRRWTG